MAIVVDEHHQSVVQACEIAELSRTAFYRPPAASADADVPIITALTAPIAEEGRWGFWKCFDRLRALVHPWNHKRVYRVYGALKPNQVRLTKKRVQPRRWCRSTRCRSSTTRGRWISCATRCMTALCCGA